jgi:type III restriction enzyme
MLFCQLEAAETAIYLGEAAQKMGDAWIRNALEEANERCNHGLNRIALKMATRSGKTVVMAMLIAWQTLNKVASPNDSRFARRFLVVTPGLTIRDRLRGLLPENLDNYYWQRDLVPADLYTELLQARIVITNFHAFQLRGTKQGQSVAKTTKELLAGYSGAPSPFRESWKQMVSRVCRDLGGTSEKFSTWMSAPTASARWSTIRCSPTSEPRSGTPVRIFARTSCRACLVGAIAAIAATSPGFADSEVMHDPHTIGMLLV